MKLTEGFNDIFYYGEYELEVNMSFDNIILFSIMLDDDDFDDMEKILIGLEMLLYNYNDIEELNIMEQADILIEIMEEFLGVVISENQPEAKENISVDPEDTNEPKTDKQLDFVIDADRIYASFMMDYKIDLIEEQGKLHWKKFLALLNGLSERTPLMQVIGIRTMEIPKKDDKNSFEKYRNNIIKAKKKYALEQEQRSADDVFQDLALIFGGGGE